jgi:hypothetical protein
MKRNIMSTYKSTAYYSITQLPPFETITIQYSYNYKSCLFVVCCLLFVVCCLIYLISLCLLTLYIGTGLLNLFRFANKSFNLPPPPPPPPNHECPLTSPKRAQRYGLLPHEDATYPRPPILHSSSLPLPCILLATVDAILYYGTEPSILKAFTPCDPLSSFQCNKCCVARSTSKSKRRRRKKKRISKYRRKR